MSASGTREYLSAALHRAEQTAKRRGLAAVFERLPWVALRRRKRRALADICTAADSYLLSSGWLVSRRDKASVDASGQPQPWFTYPSVQFIAARIDPAMSVFEYGSGASTLWWAARVRTVVSCEHDAAWYARMAAMVPANVRLIHAPERRSYAQQILATHDRFDVVVIDGECRVECARSCVHALKPEGIIVWDNSERAVYQEGFDFLSSLNFRRLDFAGLGPINVYGWSTSVFYRPGNCFRI